MKRYETILHCVLSYYRTLEIILYRQTPNPKPLLYALNANFKILAPQSLRAPKPTPPKICGQNCSTPQAMLSRSIASFRGC